MMLRRSFLLIIPLFLLTISRAPAGEQSPRDVLETYFQQETARVRAQALDGFETLSDWKSRREDLHQQLAEMLGLWPLPERTPLEATVTGTIKGEDVIVEKIHFQSRPGLYVTGNLWRPREQSKPLPAILYVCGHAQVKKNGISYGSKVHYQHHGAWYARNGYVCFIIDTLQLGEIEGIHHGLYPRFKTPASTPDEPAYATRWWWYSRGYTPAGVETWDGMRAIDYLLTREEIVDPERIGVTGRSGGGAYSWFIAAMDKRVDVAAPVAGITDLEDHVVNDCIEGHCDCMFFINTRRWDYPLLAALVAPQPLLICNTDRDSIFPLDGVMRVHHFTRKIYRLYDKAENLGVQISWGPHQDTQELRIGSFVWFNRFFKGKRRIIVDPGDKPFTAKQLKVFEELPEDEKNTTIDQTFVARAEIPEVPDSYQDWDKLRAQWRQALAETTFAGWPHSSSPPDVDPVGTSTMGEWTIREYRVTTQAPFSLPLYVVTRIDDPKPSSVRFVPISDEEDWLSLSAALFGEDLGPAGPSEKAQQWRERLAPEGVATVLFVPRGIGPTNWTEDARDAIHIRRRFMMLGQTLPGMRAWDVRRVWEALDAVEPVADLPIDVIARGPAASTWVLHAAIDGPENLRRITLKGLPADYHDSPALLAISQILNVPQTVALVASETPVVLKEADSAAWSWPRSLAEKLDWAEGQLRIVP